MQCCHNSKMVNYTLWHTFPNRWTLVRKSMGSQNWKRLDWCGLLAILNDWCRDAKMRQLRSAIQSERYLAKKAWVETIFLLMINHNSGGITVVNYTSIHRNIFHKFVSKITIRNIAMHTNVLCYVRYNTTMQNAK